MIDKSKWIGIFKIEIRNTKTGKSKYVELKNRVMDTFLNQLINCINGDTPDLEYKYLVIGTNGDPITDTQTTLGTEIKRVVPTTSSFSVSVGKREMGFTLLGADAVAHIKEVGIMAGSSATSAVDTGTLVTRILWDYDKSVDEEFIIRRIDIIGRG